MGLAERMGALCDELVGDDRTDFVKEEQVGAERDEREGESADSSGAGALGQEETQAERDEKDDECEEGEEAEGPVLASGPADGKRDQLMEVWGPHDVEQVVLTLRL